MLIGEPTAKSIDEAKHRHPEILDRMTQLILARLDRALQEITEEKQ